MADQNNINSKITSIKTKVETKIKHKEKRQVSLVYIYIFLINLIYPIVGPGPDLGLVRPQATVIAGPYYPTISILFELKNCEWFTVPLLKTNKCYLGLVTRSLGLGLITTRLGHGLMNSDLDLEIWSSSLFT